MKNKLQLKKLITKRGFTLAELLIIIAIIAVLIAIAIPIFKKQLEKSRETVDIHTMRTVASAAQEFYYAGVHDKDSATAAGMGWYDGGIDGSNAFAVYDPSTNKFYTSWDAYIDAGGKPYGKGTTANGGTNIKDVSGAKVYDPKLDYTKAGCQVSIYPNGSKPRIEVAWKLVQKGKTRPFVGGNNHPVYTIYLYDA